MRELIESAMDRQIKDQVEGKYGIELKFGDGVEDVIELYSQGNKFWISPRFIHHFVKYNQFRNEKAKRISKADFQKIMKMSNLKIDGDVRRGKGKTKLTYDEFFDRYYNKK